MVSYMAEWSGSKESMPPENMDNFGQGAIQDILDQQEVIEE